MEFIEVSGDGFGFRTADTHRPFVPVGANYDHDYRDRLIEDYWADEWPKVEEDFEEMAALGLDVVRIHLQLNRFMTGPKSINQTSFERLDRLVDLAHRLGLYLDLTGLAHYRKSDIPAWFLALDDDAMQESEAFFWSETARRYADEPSIFCYDLQNEPLVNLQDTSEIVGAPFENKFTFVNLKMRTPSRPWSRWPKGDHPDEDLIRFAHDRAVSWTRAMTTAIRSHDRRHLVTIGLLPGSLPFEDYYWFFAPTVLAPYLDFMSVHLHLSGTAEANNRLASEMILRAAYVKKPVVVEEYSLLVPDDVRERFLERAFRSASGFIGYYWGETAETLRSLGTMKAAIDADAIGRLQRIAKTLQARPPGRKPGDETINASITRIRLDPNERSRVIRSFDEAALSGKYVDFDLTP